MYPCIKNGHIIGVLDTKYIPGAKSIDLGSRTLGVRQFCVMKPMKPGPPPDRYPEIVDVLILEAGDQTWLLMNHNRFFWWP